MHLMLPPRNKTALCLTVQGSWPECLPVCAIIFLWIEAGLGIPGLILPLSSSQLWAFQSFKARLLSSTPHLLCAMQSRPSWTRKGLARDMHLSA